MSKHTQTREYLALSSFLESLRPLVEDAPATLFALDALIAARADASAEQAEVRIKLGEHNWKQIPNNPQRYASAPKRARSTLAKAPCLYECACGCIANRQYPFWFRTAHLQEWQMAKPVCTITPR